MKKLIATFLTGMVFATPVMAERAVEAEKAFETIFSPLDYDTYFTAVDAEDRAYKELSENVNLLVDFLYPTLFALKAGEKVEPLHKLVLDKRIAVNVGAKAEILGRTQIDALLDGLDQKGLRGQQRVSLIIEDKSLNTGKIGNVINGKNVDRLAANAQMTTTSKQSPLIFKNITKEELRQALLTLSDNRVHVYSAGIGQAKVSAIKVVGAAAAVYLTIDLVDNVVFGM